MENSVIQIVSEILQPRPVKIEETAQFKGVLHKDILSAYDYWLNYLRLLVKEPILIEITQGLQDDGVDLVIRFLKSDTTVGLQVKSYLDLTKPTFQQEGHGSNNSIKKAQSLKITHNSLWRSEQ